MNSCGRFSIGVLTLSFVAINAAGQLCPCNPNDPLGNCDRPESPLMLKLSEGPWRLTGLEDPVQFDISADGHMDIMGWTYPGSDVGFLALDRNGNGTIDDGSELFGTATPLPDGTRASDGFIALAQYDENRDGVIDKSDRIWNSLLLWIDRNHDGISQPGELTAISASPVTTIGLANHWTGRHDTSGNLFRYEGVARIGERTQNFYDIYYVITPHAKSSADVKQSADNDVVFREATRRLSAEPSDVGREYERLASAPSESRRHLLAALPNSLKSAVWAHHLLLAITTHPEFTAEQRSVIYDGIRLLSPALYEGHLATTRKDLNDLTLRARRLFSPDVALSLFVEIGSAIPESRVALNESTTPSLAEGDQGALPKRDENARRFPRPKPMALDCSCSVWNDWCAVAQFPGAGWSCTLANCNLKENPGCGLLGAYTCDGLCVYTAPPPS